MPDRLTDDERYELAALIQRSVVKSVTDAQRARTQELPDLVARYEWRASILRSAATKLGLPFGGGRTTMPDHLTALETRAVVAVIGRKMRNGG